MVGGQKSVIHWDNGLYSVRVGQIFIPINHFLVIKLLLKLSRQKQSKKCLEVAISCNWWQLVMIDDWFKYDLWSYGFRWVRQTDRLATLVAKLLLQLKMH